MSSYSTSLIPSGIQILPSAIDFPAVGLDGQQLVAADTNTIYIYQEQAPAGWKPVANPGAAIAIDALTGEVTATGPGVVAATITNAAVTNAKLAAMADNTVKGNKSGVPASPSDLTLSDVTETVSSVLTITNGSKAVVSPANLTIQVLQSSALQSGYLSSADWSTFNSKQNALTFGNLSGDMNANISVTGGTGAVIGMGTSISQSAATALAGGYLTSTDWSTFNNKVDSVSGSAPISSSGGTTPTISISQSGVATDGYLSSADWNTFNGKQNALMFGNLSGDTNANISISGGTGSVIGTGTTISQTAASALTNGYLTSADWSTFNSKQNALTTGNLSEVTSSVLTISGGTGCVIGSGTTIQVQQAGPATSGYLSSADYTTFSGKQPAGNYITDLTGEVTASGPGSVAATISANAVTNAKLAQMPANRIKGNNTAGLSDPLDLTTAQTTAMLDVMVGDSGAGGTKGLVPAPVTGDATKYLRGDATWQTISVPASADPYLSNLLSPTSINQSLLFLNETFDIGASAASRPNNIYVKNSVVVNGITFSRGNSAVSSNIAIGANSLNSNSTGSANTAIGNNAAQYLTTSANSTAIGNNALQGTTTTPVTAGFTTVIGSGAGQYISTPVYNTAVGFVALQGQSTGAVTGQENTAMGAGAARYITSGSQNVAIGAGALQGTASTAVTGSFSTFVGYQAGQFISTPNSNVGIGYQAIQGQSSTPVTGINNTIVGTQAGRYISTAASTVAIGQNALVGSAANPVTGANNTVVGAGSAGAVTSGNALTIVGQGSATSLTTAANNTIVGQAAAVSLTTHSNNTAIGFEAANNLTATNFVAIGYQALKLTSPAANRGDGTVSIGYSSGIGDNGQYSVHIGYNAGKGSGSGSGNSVYIGGRAGESGTNSFNTAVGYICGKNAKGILNAFYGYESGASDGGSPQYNSAFGAYSLDKVTTSGEYNSAIGYQSGYSITSGARNVTLGAYAGYRSTTQSNELFIDNQDRSTYAAQQTDSLIYGTFNATAGSQTLFVNAKQTVRRTTSATSTVTPVLQLDSESSGTPANGIGVSLEMAAETAAGNTEIGVVLEAVTTDVTSTSEDFDLVVKNMAAGATAAETLRVASTGDVTAKTGNILIDTAGKGLTVKSGSNAKIGVTGAFPGGNPNTVTVSNTSVTSNSIILVSPMSFTGGLTGAPYVSAITASTSFVITVPDNSFTGTVGWVIVEQS